MSGTPLVALGERAIDVGCRQYAIDAAVLLEEEVLVRGQPGDRPDQVLPGQSHRQGESGLEAASDGSVGNLWAAFLGHGQQRSLVDVVDRCTETVPLGVDRGSRTLE